MTARWHKLTAWLGWMSLLAISVASWPIGSATLIQERRILLIGKDRDHPFGTHEYMTDCAVLAKCLEQTPGIRALVSNCLLYTSDAADE